MTLGVKKPTLLLVGLTAFLITLSGFAAALTMAYLTRDQVARGVSVAGISIGGMSHAEASSVLEANLGRLDELPIVLKPTDPLLGPVIAIPEDIGIRIDVDEMVERAGRAGRSRNPFKLVSDRYRFMTEGYHIPLLYAVDDSVLEAFLESVGESIFMPAQNASFSVTPEGTIEILPSRPGRMLGERDFKKQIIRASLSESSRTVELTVVPIEPEFSTEDAREAGVTELIGSYTTSFDTTDVNRSHNLEVAARAIDGTLVPPSGTISFNDLVGPRSPERGYLDAPVIIDGELIPDVGGGVCQVSTTLYNAALSAELQIVTRHAHSIPVKYVPLGRDATVAYDYLDLEIRNNTSKYILISTDVKDGNLSVSIYGTSGYGAAGGGRRSRLVSVIDEVLEPEVIEVVDYDLPKGEKVEVKRGARGYRVSVWRERQIAPDVESAGAEDTVEGTIEAGSAEIPGPRAGRPEADAEAVLSTGTPGGAADVNEQNPDSRIVRELVSVSVYKPRPKVVRVGAKPPEETPNTSRKELSGPAPGFPDN